MSARRYDAVVLGGGPAGAAAALSLARRGHAVALVEASSYDAPRIGEALTPPVRGVLEHLGVEPLLLDGGHLDTHATHAAWGAPTPGSNPFMLSAAGRGCQVDRRRFDEQLAQAAAAAGAAVQRGARLSGAERARGGWRLVAARASGGELVLGAQVVVDATGRGARFALSQGARKLVSDRLVAVCGVFDRAGPGTPASPGAGVLVEACREGWWYTAGLPGGRAIAALLSDADIVASERLREQDRWAGALRRLPYTAARLEGAAWPSALTVRSARTQRLDSVTGPGWLAAGDAAATVDPLSSQGILKALRGGIFASYAIGDLLAGDAGALERYAAFVTTEYDDDLAARAEHYGAERRWEDARFWSRRRPAALLAA